MDNIDNVALEKVLNSNMGEATQIVHDKDKIERLLERVEHKLTLIPVVGEKLSDVPVFISLVRAYAKKQYTDIPVGSIIAIVAALLYLVSHFDLIPDSIPGAGLLDDAALIAFVATTLVHDDMEEYRAWRKENGL
jgi:uncharacterized membrane protein YkvA (DUF1232 family)